MDRSDAAKPMHWFNEHRNPAIDVGLFAFPAYVLPVLVALVFLWTQPHRRFLRRLNRNPFELRAGTRNGVRNDQAGDFPRQLQGLLALFHVFCTGPALTQGRDHYKNDLFGYGSAEALSLLIAAFYLDPAMLTSYLGTSLGWMLLAIDQRTATAVLLLSLPCAWQLMGQTGLHHWQSGILLFLLALDYTDLEMVNHVRDVVTHYLYYWSLAVYMTCLLIGGSLSLIHSAARQENLQEAVDTILAGLYDTCVQVMKAIALVAVFLGPLALNTALTGFLGSCIGWRYIVVGRYATSPFEMGFAILLWCILYGLLWCVVQLLTENRDPQRREDYFDTFLHSMVISVDVTGLAATIMVLLWWTILTVPHHWTSTLGLGSEDKEPEVGATSHVPVCTRQWDCQTGTWRERLRSLEHEEAPTRREVCVPVEQGKTVKVTLSFLSDGSETDSTNIKVENPGDTTATSASVASDTTAEAKSPTLPRPQYKTNSHRQPTVEDEPVSDATSADPQECPSQTSAPDAEDGFADDNGDDDLEDQYLLSVTHAFGADFAAAVANKAVKAGSSSKQ
ncbi:hypothetical protein PRZ48_000993 [Zasmidium cellare]|uniref:Uncharacterized protein n=1 Tax=Zasmidium cellare TaxID=395010 RepID=A0ABR0F1C1_ZASCE|nr:hypothetical protein PRZ48_000993 [Zasmidium cellare]